MARKQGEIESRRSRGAGGQMRWIGREALGMSRLQHHIFILPRGRDLKKDASRAPRSPGTDITARIDIAARLELGSQHARMRITRSPTAAIVRAMNGWKREEERI